MISSLIIPQSMKISIIWVDSYKDKVMSGRISNAYFESEKTFNNYMDLVFIMDKMLNAVDEPEITGARQFNEKRKNIRQITGRRHIINKPQLKSISELHSERNKITSIATFTIHILSRQNSDWQGKIVWLEENQTQYFRSILELAKLIDSVLTEK